MTSLFPFMCLRFVITRIFDSILDIHMVKSATEWGLSKLPVRDINLFLTSHNLLAHIHYQLLHSLTTKWVRSWIIQRQAQGALGRFVTSISTLVHSLSWTASLEWSLSLPNPMLLGVKRQQSPHGNVQNDFDLVIHHSVIPSSCSLISQKTTAGCVFFPVYSISQLLYLSWILFV